MITRLAMVVAFGLMVAGMAIGAPIVANPSFEDSPFPQGPAGPSGWNEGLGSPTGWTYAGGHGGGVYGGSEAPNLTGNVKVTPVPDGTHAAYLWTAWGADATMSQTIGGFQIGTQYTLTYRENSNVNENFPGDTASVTLGATTLVAAHAVTPVSASSWTTVTASFIATATSDTLTFHMSTSANGDRTALVFDAVSIAEAASAVPEPATFGLVALGALGLVLRRSGK